MIYSKTDVQRMLVHIKTELDKVSWFYKNDCIPPKVVMMKQVEDVLSTVEKTI